MFLEVILRQLTYYLAKLRHERKLTTKELARLSGVSFRTIEQIEAKRANPAISTLCKLADALDVPLTDLFSYE